jgi:hypothetical protein
MRSFLLLVTMGCLLTACSDDPPAFNPTPIDTAERASLGPNALAWLSPYLNRSTVTFRNDAGQTQTFRISSTSTRQLFLPFDRTLSETFELLLTSTQNAGEVLAFKPVGRNYVSVGNTPQVDIDANKVFGIFFAPFGPGQNYWAQVFSRGGALATVDYTYGPLYPSNGSDAVRIALNRDPAVTATPDAVFFREIVLRQGTGVESYVDRTGMRWQQVEVR